MIFQPFPSLSEYERLKHNEPIKFTATLQPLYRLLSSKNENPNQVTLVSILGEPYYWWQDANRGRITVVHAETGESPEFGFDQIRKIAEHFYPKKSIKKIHAPVEYDQWIVSNRFDPFRPFYRVD